MLKFTKVKSINRICAAAADVNATVVQRRLKQHFPVSLNHSNFKYLKSLPKKFKNMIHKIKENLIYATKL